MIEGLSGGRIFRVDSTWEAADINEIHLPALSSVCRVNEHGIAVRAETGMKVTTPLSSILLRRRKDTQVYTVAGLDIVNIKGLLSALSTRIRVIQNPLISRQI